MRRLVELHVHGAGPSRPGPARGSKRRQAHQLCRYQLPPGLDCSKTPNPNPPAAPAAAPAPTINVNPNQGSQNITFAVQYTSTEDLKCVYNAKKLSCLIGPPTTTRDFSLKAGASTTLSFVEIPVGTTYQVDISCTGQTGNADYSHNFTG